MLSYYWGGQVHSWTGGTDVSRIVDEVRTGTTQYMIGLVFPYYSECLVTRHIDLTNWSPIGPGSQTMRAIILRKIGEKLQTRRRRHCL